MFTVTLYSDGPAHDKVWSGNLPALPRVGEIIELPDSYGREVSQVAYLLEADGSCEIVITVT
jgi:hypothetical protein